MLHGTHRTYERSAALPTFSTKAKNDTPANDSNAASFGEQLANAFGSYFSQATDGTPLEFTITPQAGQDSGTRQFVVTLRTPASTSSASTPSTATAPAGALINYGAMTPFTYGAAKYAVEHPEGVAETAPAATSEPPKPANETDAYWAQFPKEVQALRDIPNREDRIPVAWGLVHQGFTIDAEIMVLGNDPYATMLMRQQNGYTWTPAMGQPPLDLLPGLYMEGHKPYDPLHPPAGAIRMSLEFARGLESTSPAMQYSAFTAAT